MTTVCLGAYSLRFARGGGYAWMFLNWALGLRALGCRVLWLDSVAPEMAAEQVRADLCALKRVFDAERVVAGVLEKAL